MGEIFSQIGNPIIREEGSKISLTFCEISCGIDKLITRKKKTSHLLSEQSSSSSSPAMTKLPLAPNPGGDQVNRFERSKNGEKPISIESNRKDEEVTNLIKKATATVLDDLVSIEEDDNDDGNNNNGGSMLIAKRTYSTSSLLDVSEGISNFPRMASRPLWGLTSVRGRRAEMEDYAVAIPQFLKIPSPMLREGLLYQDLAAHFFAVYDGHGGFQVADYCREHLHLALAEEIKENFHAERSNLKELWQKVFMKCFRRMDDEVGGFERIVDGKISRNPPIAPDSVGSTAVVVIVCSTHIIVGNCGDSRAVLNRGKLPMPLSVDHKPNREDECERIEATGGRIINWDGCRVSGILAVSRSIGDRLLRPYVIADPEVALVPRTKQDECLVIASDGLWDVMTDEEACDLARRRLLLWHKKYGASVPNIGRGPGENAVDSASQDASDYLSRVAFQRGSRDNISVIVVDLKAQRKFKRKV